MATLATVQREISELRQRVDHLELEKDKTQQLLIQAELVAPVFRLPQFPQCLRTIGVFPRVERQKCGIITRQGNPCRHWVPCKIKAHRKKREALERDASIAFQQSDS